MAEVEGRALLDRSSHDPCGISSGNHKPAAGRFGTVTVSVIVVLPKAGSDVVGLIASLTDHADRERNSQKGTTNLSMAR